MKWGIFAGTMTILACIALLLLMSSVHQPQYRCTKYEMQTVTFHRLVGLVPAPRTEVQSVCIEETVIAK